eukprot:gene14635-20669_t
MGSCSSQEAVAANSNEPVDKARVSNPSTADEADGPRLLDRTADIRELYTFDKMLGKGNFGIVHLVKEKATGKDFACKSISKSKLVTDEDIEDVRREIQILQHLAGHENIVFFHQWYEDNSYIHMVMECCEGGELFDVIAEQGHFSEKKAAELMRTVVSVVNHCHTMNVVHRDLKPENFLLTGKGPGATLKATDFGLSKFFKEGVPLDEIVGSPYYIAPEVLKRNYGKEADIWSCGVMLHIMLCGWPPFFGENAQQIFRSIISSPLNLQSSPWPRISDAAKDIVRRMLSRDPRRRLTAEQVLKHPWMKVNGAALDEPLEPEVLTRFRNFTQMNKLKKQALRLIAVNLPTSELRGIKEMFKAMDNDNSATITVNELREGLKNKGAGLAFTEVAKLAESMDINGDNTIDCTIHTHT